MHLTYFLLIFHVHAIPLCCIEDIFCYLCLKVENILFGDTVCYQLCDFGCPSHRYSKFILFQGFYHVGNMLLLCWFEGGEYFT